MKFIHCADLHLDSKMETNLSPEKAKERKAEILKTFERMVIYAQENKVTGIIIAGDMFDTSRVTKSTKERVLNIIIKNPQIDFIYLSGNHDESNFISQIEVMPANLKVFTDEWQTFAYGNIKITGKIIDEHRRDNALETLKLNAEDYNIVVLHGEISRQAVNLDKLKNKNIDYLALGHIHTYSQDKLDERGIYCYAGCLEGRGFDECGAKGFVLLEVEDNVAKTQFIDFAKRRLAEVKCDISNCDDWFSVEDKIKTLVKDIPKQNLLKITLTGRYDLNLEKQLETLPTELDNFYCVKINDESILDLTSKDLDKDISLRGEFIRKVLASNLNDKEKEQTIIVGLKALNGDL